MIKEEALRMALEALELEDLACRYEKEPTPKHISKAITALKQALEQPEPEPEIMCPDCQAIEQAEKQEPVAVGSVVKWLDGSLVHGWFGEPPPEGTLLYTHPPKHAWVGLTDEEVQMFIDARWGDGVNFTHFIRAIEAKLKEKNT